ncbi:MAG: ABC transporter ATP-binding protein [Lachnospiraceae bacterium]|jgi:NitT/TauT family transport system ATP-binding protein|nr:ABC transporter ATP-binding protein [Lachnospiraceae bacterium]
MGELLKIDHISYTYHSLEGETPALFDVSFSVMDGEFISIVGPSGCGKSTLLSLIAGLIIPSSGFIYINGKDVKSSGKNIGYMLQKDHLLDWRNTLKNVSLGLEIQHKLNDHSYLQIDELLNMYGLITFKNSYPSELSGGMRQRAALIRTLLLEPDILLLDEPFSALDYQTRLEVADDIWGIIRKEKKTAILITHDISEAISMADRVIVLSSRPGTVVNVFDTKFSIEHRTPFATRNAPEFREYFNQIWKELDHHEQET